jgi:hypothetical protein
LRQQPLTIPAPNPARIDSVGEVVLALLRCHREKGGGIMLATTFRWFSISLRDISEQRALGFSRWLLYPQWAL